MSATRAPEHAPPLPGRERLDGLSLPRFAALLASSAPTPGGSTAAAVPAALAAGLVAMVARLSAACDPFGDLSYDMDDVAREADELRIELLDLAEEDASAFRRVMEARRRTTADQETDGGRAAEIQHAYEAAVEPPMSVCRRSLRTLELAAEVRARGNPNAAADSDVAMLFAAASLEAAALTVELYLRPIESDAFCATRRSELEAIRAHAMLVPRAAPAPISAGG